MKQPILLLYLFLQLSVLAAQQRIYVHSSASGAANGTSWANAFTDLQLALQSAAYGDTMWVAEGMYRPTSDDNRDSSFVVPNGLRLYGGFAGTETELAQRDWAAHPVILDGNIGDQADTTDNSYTILFMPWPDSFTVVDGFTFRFGYAEPHPLQFQDGTEPTICGGALYIQGFEGSAYADIRNCTFEHNYAWSAGGAVMVNGKGEDASVAPRFLNCTFRHNRTAGYGGALYRYGGSWAERYPDFGDCLFEQNFAAQWGGGLYYYDTERTDTLHFSGCRFVENEGEQDAGGMALTIGRVAGASMIVRGCEFDGNHTQFGENSAIRQNAIFQPLNTFIVSHTTFSHHNKNVIQLLGIADENISLRLIDQCKFNSINGVVNGQASYVKCVNSNFSDSNIRLSLGPTFSGANDSIILESNVIKESSFVFVSTTYQTKLKISNNLFLNNFNSENFFRLNCDETQPPPVILNTAFINNSVYPENFQQEDHDDPDVIYQNCLFYQMDIDPTPGFYSGHIFFDHCYFDEFGCTDQLPYTTCTNTLIGGDPGFVDTALGDYRLSACSMLRDAGSNIGLDNVPTDLAGNPRIQDGTVDIGAYETPGFSLAAPATAPPICADTASGSINLPAAGGCEPYTVAWQNGPQSGTGLTGLGAGVYFLSITDQGGRLLRDTVVIQQGGIPQISRDVAPVVCGDTLGGSVALSATGGLSPYTYRWQDGQESPSRTGLTTGVYNATVSDAAGCSAVAEVVMGSVGTLDVDAQIGEISCNGAMDGTLSVMPLDGRPPYGYNWSEGPHSPHLNHLGPGLYYATVTDALGCSAVYLFNLSEPPLLSALIDSTAASGPTQADGSLSAQGQGGTGPYQFAWSNGDLTPVANMLLPGPYELTMTDQRGCTFTGLYSVPFTIAATETENAQPSAFLYPNPAQSQTALHLQNWPKKDGITLDCRDAAGRQMLWQQVDTQARTAVVDINTSDWPSATYRLVLVSGSMRVAMPLVVRK